MLFRTLLIAGLVCAGLANGHAQDDPLPPPAPPHVLIVGGGPDLEHNQVAIESNVRYVNRLLPAESPRRILFADGRAETSDVLYLDDRGRGRFRAPNLPKIDGASRLLPFHDALIRVAKDGAVAGAPAPPLLLYFTGHGSPAPHDIDNNRYDLWGDSELSVERLATEISALPADESVTLVMVECFSGAFGNLLFEGGRPQGALIDRPICGFFASVAQRMAAGCTPEVNEDDYHDFTGYFFAALCGQDRKGRPVTGADYNHDGKVGMDEAYAYTLIHDISIDTPVCTSDVFLRRFVKTSDSELFHNSYSQVLSWASPSQAAALEGLSGLLKLTGEDRLTRAYARFRRVDPDSEESADVYGIRLVRLAKSVMLGHILMTGDDAALKARFAALTRLEAANPLARKIGDESKVK